MAKNFAEKLKKTLALVLALAMVVTLTPLYGAEAEAATAKITGSTTVYVGTNNVKVTGVTKKQYVKVVVSGTAKSSVTTKYGSKTLKTASVAKATKVTGTGKALTFKVTSKAAAGGKKYKVAVYVYNASNNKKVKTLSKTVAVYKKTTSIKLSKSSATIVKDKTLTLKATVKPASGTKAVTWKSSKTSVATVTKKGVVTAKAAGKATITATAGNKSAKCVVTVKNPEVKVTGVSLSTTTPKVGATITAVTTPENATNVASYQWYADGVAIEGATSADYVVLKTDKDKKLKVVVTDTEGTEFTSEESQAVIEDLSVEVTLTDKAGLQTDGTALPSDSIELTYGSTLGTPSIIVWYRNGAAVGIYKDATLNQGFNNGDFIDGTISTEMKSGEWYVTIENTKGETFVSNSITVAEAGIAVMSDVSIEDDYETPAVTVDKTTGNAILNVTLNKAYAGTFYLVPANTKTFKNDIANQITVAATTPLYMTEVTKAKDFTNKNATAAYVEDDGTGTDYTAWTTIAAGTLKPGAENGLVYIDDEGHAHYKFIVNLDATSEIGGGSDFAVTRGSEYFVIFDQDDVDADDMGTTSSAKKEDLNISATCVAPYVKAPTSVKVTDKQVATNTAGWTATLYDGEDVAKYINIAKTDDGVIGSIDLYEGVSTDTSKGTKFVTDTDEITEGKADVKGAAGTAVGAAAGGEMYVYAKLSVYKGVFGADKFELTSDPAGIPDPIATTAVLSESEDDAKDIVVTLGNVKNAAKAYLLTMDYDSTTNNTADKRAKAAVDDFKDDSSKYVAVVDVAKGSAKVTFDDVLEKVEDVTHKDVYTVVIVPENTDDYRNLEIVTTATGAIEIGQEETTYVLEKKTGVTGTVTITVNDQFGDKMETVSAITQKSMLGAAKNTGTNALKFKMDTAGKVTLTAGGTDDTVNDEWYIAINSTATFHAQVTHVSGNTADAWTCWID